MEASTIHAIEAAAIGFLGKPFDGRALLDAVARAVRRADR